jgi:hypothetical protein
MSLSKWVPVVAVMLVTYLCAASGNATPLQKSLVPAWTDNLLHKVGGYEEYGGYRYRGDDCGSAHGYYRSDDCTGHYGHGHYSGCRRSYPSYGYFDDGYYRRAYRPYYDGDQYEGY